MATERARTSSSVLHRDLKRLPRTVVRGAGNYLYLQDGTAILDACGGAAVVSIGHADPRVVEGMSKQLRTMTFVHSGEYAVPVAEELADRLCASAGMARALFMSSGSEAIESAIKMARHFHIENGQPERVNFISRDLSYHGNCLGSLALSGHKQRRAAYEPLLSPAFHKVSAAHFYRLCQPGESESAFVTRLAAELEAKIVSLDPHTVAAFFLEPTVGAALGCVPAPPGYLAAVREVCDRYGVLLVFDEVRRSLEATLKRQIMSGTGRTGYMHAWQHDGVQPDIQVSAKGLSSGYAPLSAIMMNQRVYEVFSAGSGAFVNAINRMSWCARLSPPWLMEKGCRAALEVLKVMESDGLIAQCRARGVVLERCLREQLSSHPNVGDIRGRGLFWGVEFVRDRTTKECLPLDVPVSAPIGESCMRQGVAIYACAKGTADGTNGDHILVAPSYTVTEDECQRIARVLRRAIDEVLPVTVAR